MPPTERSVLMWSATFAPGRTFLDYIAHLRKGRALLGDPSDWATKAVYSAADGLRKAKKGTFKFPNSLFMADDPISEPVGQPVKALMGVRLFRGSDASVMKIRTTLTDT